MQNRKSVEELIKRLEHYLPGNRESRRVKAIGLLNQLLEEKALVMMRRIYKLQAYRHLEVLISDLEELGEVWSEEKIDKLKPKRSPKKRGSVSNVIGQGSEGEAKSKAS